MYQEVIIYFLNNGKCLILGFICLQTIVRVSYQTPTITLGNDMKYMKAVWKLFSTTTLLGKVLTLQQLILHCSAIVHTEMVICNGEPTGMQVSTNNSCYNHGTFKWLWAFDSLSQKGKISALNRVPLRSGWGIVSTKIMSREGTSLNSIGTSGWSSSSYLHTGQTHLSVKRHAYTQSEYSQKVYR